LFGVIGTLCSFATQAICTLGLFKIIDFNMFNPLTGDRTMFNFSIKDILLFSALMSSTETHASVSSISFDTRPKLYSIVNGESMINDAITIILFN
jgi:NhaP-type Na+/H+ or K+/H+ antiporter